MAGKRSTLATLKTRIGAAIAARRKSIGWSQPELAESVGVSPETISRFERGVSLPSIPTLAALAERLHCSPSELLDASAVEPISGADKLAASLSALKNDSDRAYVVDQFQRLCSYLQRRR